MTTSTATIGLDRAHQSTDPVTLSYPNQHQTVTSQLDRSLNRSETLELRAVLARMDESEANGRQHMILLKEVTPYFSPMRSAIELVMPPSLDKSEYIVLTAQGLGELKITGGWGWKTDEKGYNQEASLTRMNKLQPDRISAQLLNAVVTDMHNLLETNPLAALQEKPPCWDEFMTVKSSMVSKKFIALQDLIGTT